MYFTNWVFSCKWQNACIFNSGDFYEKCQFFQLFCFSPCVLLIFFFTLYRIEIYKTSTTPSCNGPLPHKRWGSLVPTEWQQGPSKRSQGPLYSQIQQMLLKHIFLNYIRRRRIRGRRRRRRRSRIL